MVLFYLIRMEPFTAMNRNLQGGRFDHADRLFFNVAATWENCLHSSSDVKELTPEFYHQPEFLLNSNDFELGTQQVQSNSKVPLGANNKVDAAIRGDNKTLTESLSRKGRNRWKGECLWSYFTYTHTQPVAHNAHLLFLLSACDEGGCPWASS